MSDVSKQKDSDSIELGGYTDRTRILTMKIHETVGCSVHNFLIARYVFDHKFLLQVEVPAGSCIICQAKRVLNTAERKAAKHN